MHRMQQSSKPCDSLCWAMDHFVIFGAAVSSSGRRRGLDQDLTVPRGYASPGASLPSRKSSWILCESREPHKEEAVVSQGMSLRVPTQSLQNVQYNCLFLLCGGRKQQEQSTNCCEQKNALRGWAVGGAECQQPSQSGCSGMVLKDWVMFGKPVCGTALHS